MNRTSGEGIKRCQLWRTNATKEELQFKREEFWGTKTKGDPQVWKILRLAIEEPNDERSNELIKKAGVGIRPGIITSVFDRNANIYEIPAYAISEPESFGTGLYTVKKIDVGDQKEIPLTLRWVGVDDLNASFSSHAQIEDIKHEFVRKHEMDADNVRLFYNGKELKDGYQLGNFDVIDETVIQVFVVNKMPLS